ncbi:SET domain-containing protein SmydA-8-like isoform X2 [Contarinia nasturtii]|uniref:SET domain-containing protein SmydA-8-like isoform X2 n=1 Tax=Contarinia nasturtii TaxID=265458 RepID=UPI0012D450A1|nr:SET domain-containing protein SmydA-8-like isoform X2 [Contarinia nasturtii]
MANFLYKKCALDTNEKFGRFVIAAQDIKAGELLLSELPIVCGPYWDTKINCLNCYAPSDTMCKKCKVVPLCWNCHDNHDAVECDTLEKLDLPKTYLIDNFDVVTPLRVLLLFYRYAMLMMTTTSSATSTTTATTNAPTIDTDLKYQIDEILSMESHMEQRRNTWIWNEHAKNVLQPLRSINIDAKFQSFNAPWTLTDDFLQKICGILDVNTFEFRTQHFEEFPVRGLFTQAALLAHDCIGNTLITVDNNKVLKVFASVDIKEGEIIYNNYTASLYGTEARQEHLTKGKYFECECRRCNDPTEFGTHLSSVKCQSCTMGYIIRMNCKTTWKCLNCNTNVANEKIQLILRDIRIEVQQMRPNIEHIDLLIAKYTKILHPNHYLLIEMKQKLAAVIRHMSASAYDIAINAYTNDSKISPLENLLQRKIDLCKEFIPLLQILTPGISRLKAIALYEQFAPLVQLARLHHQHKIITDAEYLRQLCEAEIIVKESIGMLLYEPSSNPEGMLCKQAMFELKELRLMKQRVEKSIKKASQSTKTTAKTNLK